VNVSVTTPARVKRTPSVPLIGRLATRPETPPGSSEAVCATEKVRSKQIVGPQICDAREATLLNAERIVLIS